ncbi:hypothetical protein [uncultured Desulfobacter sp.]|jgi:hypothetical protein|uniref:hypothetical protein n=1 Tax=uncultured Desulfobacter sp. TaxID=240139 RepID=UPI0029C8868C|nr:hypothetical protein [uncultured Desulfobacter sp.]
MKCPTCGCEKFYVKDDDDEYEIYEFTTLGKNVVFDKALDSQEIPKITNEIHTFCNKCAWNGKFNTLTK